MYKIFISFAQEPLFIIAAVCLIGLIIQKKPLKKIISGTIIAAMGYILISFGSRMIIESLSIYIFMFQNAFHLFGIVPNNESIVAILHMDYSYEITIVMFFGMVFNIIFVRFTRFKYIFLNIQHVLYMAALIATIVSLQIGFSFIALFLGGLFLGFIMSTLPSFTHSFTKKIVGEKNVTIGYFGIIGCLISGYIGKLLSLCSKKKNLCKETSEISKVIPLFSDSNIMVTISMMLLFSITSLFTNKQIIEDMSGNTNSIVFLMKYSIVFSAGFYIIISGVRMFTEQLLYSFKGISEKLVPHASLAVDCSILFPYNPKLVIIGFISSLAGGIVSIFLQAMLNLHIVIPGIISHFFSGAASAFFGNVYGGRKGAVLGSFIQGIIISFVPLLNVMAFNDLHIVRTSFADSDFGIVGFIINFVIDIFNKFL